MRWVPKPEKKWKSWFAFWPTELHDDQGNIKCIWLERYKWAEGEIWDLAKLRGDKTIYQIAEPVDF